MPLNVQAESFLARTPIQILGLSLSVALALGGIAVAVTRDGGSRQEVRTTTASPTTTTSTAPAAAAPSPGTPGSASASPSPPQVAPLPDAANPGTGPNDALVFTPAVVDPPPSPSPGQPATPVALCTPAQVDATLVTDKPAYNDGEVVNVTATIVNRSSSICAVVDPDSNCYSLLAAYGASDNRPFWRSGVLPIVPCQVFPRRPLVPGAAAELRGAWDQTDRRGCSPYGGDPLCTKPRVPGPFVIRSSWLAQVISIPVELL
ncbi:MAG TPA: hypothetical protein VMY88_07660 [Acidimicrobiales bacterium]|nr:hypothetical protein [Acidimicrobiales bacterium]